MVAQHDGIFSMGLLLTVAVGSVLLVSLTVLPLLLHSDVPERSAGGNGTAEKNALGWSDQAKMKRGPRVRLRTWGVGATGEWCGP